MKELAIIIVLFVLGTIALCIKSRNKNEDTKDL